jgi:hypothetical protein
VSQRQLRGRYAEAIAREVAVLRPGIVVHDTFAVIGPRSRTTSAFRA